MLLFTANGKTTTPLLLQNGLGSWNNSSSSIGEYGSNSPSELNPSTWGNVTQQSIQTNAVWGNNVSTSTDITSNYQTLSWPIHLGNSRYPYYMMFYINANSKSALVKSGNNTNNASTTANTSQQALSQQTAGANAQVAAFSKTGVGSAVSSSLNAIGNTTVNATNSIIKTINSVIPKSYQLSSFSKLNPQQFLATYKRVKYAFALPIPSEVEFNNETIFNNVGAGQLGTILKDAFVNGGHGLTEDAMKILAQDAPSAALGLLNSAIGGNTDAAAYGDLFKKMQGIATNDRREQIFQGAHNRSFTFTWLLIPHNQQESENIKGIIKWLKYNQYPELDSTTGLNLITPNEFDIEFMYSGSEMTGVPKIATCYLDSVREHYTPVGKWVAYEGTDNPFAVALQCRFTEIEPLIRQQISKGY